MLCKNNFQKKRDNILLFLVLKFVVDPTWFIIGNFIFKADVTPDNDVQVVLVVGVGHQGLQGLQLGRIHGPAPLQLVLTLDKILCSQIHGRLEFKYLGGHCDKLWPLLDPFCECDGILLQFRGQLICANDQMRLLLDHISKRLKIFASTKKQQIT